MCNKQKSGKTFTVEVLAALKYLDKKCTHFIDVSNLLALSSRKHN